MTKSGRIVFFTGPAGAGKSSIAEAWAASRTTATAQIDHDQARFMLRGGYVSRTAAHADPALRDEGERQWLLAAAVCESIAQTYVAWGVDVALSAFRPPGRWKGCWEQLDPLNPIIIVLLPALEVLLARDAARSGRRHTGAATVRRNFGYPWHEWRDDQRAHILDNSAQSIEQTVELVEAEVGRRALAAGS